MATSNHIEREPEYFSVIQALANETHRPVNDIDRIFAETFARLDSEARIKDYVVLLTSKTVRDKLRHSTAGERYLDDPPGDLAEASTEGQSHVAGGRSKPPAAIAPHLREAAGCKL